MFQMFVAKNTCLNWCGDDTEKEQMAQSCLCSIHHVSDWKQWQYHTGLLQIMKPSKQISQTGRRSQKSRLESALDSYRGYTAMARNAGEKGR